MQTTHRANIKRQRQIILDKINVDPFGLKRQSVPSFTKKTAVVDEFAGRDYSTTVHH
jgi:hypothetical protein